MNRRASRRGRGERGATQVEFVIICLAMLTVLFGIIEIGRLALTYTTLAQAARAATRYAIVHGFDRTGSGVDGPSGPSNTAQVVAVVTNYTSAAGMQVARLTASVSYPNGNAIGAPVSVQLTYAYAPVLSLTPLTMTLTTTSEGYICY